MQMYSSERGVWTTEQQTLQESVAILETALQEERGRAGGELAEAVVMVPPPPVLRMG